jgi:hypothetical protein
MTSENEGGTGERKDATTAKYNPDTEVSTKLCQVPILHQHDELVPHANSKESLEVGLIIGDELHKLKPTGLSRDKVREEARKNRGVMRR